MLAAAVLAPFFLAILLPVVRRRFPSINTGWFALVLPAVLFIFFLTYFPQVGKGDTVTTIIDWVPSLGLQFSLYMDGLSLLFALLITGMGALVVLYSVYYLDKKERLAHFYVFLYMFMGAMLGVVLSDNLFVLYTFWELTSLSSFLLIGYWYDRKASRQGAFKSLFITVLGGLTMLGGFILLYTTTGTASIHEIFSHADKIFDSPYYVAILITILVGAFTKSAQFPFHIWLPDAMEAPTPVSAYLHSATMVKAGIYLVARLSLPLGGSTLFFLLVSGIGLITLCWASYMAIRQTDLKAILAYSTVSQLGMIMAMLGYGTPAAVFAALFHIFNHAVFKGGLFMIAGIVDHQTGTRDIRKLGGLATLMPISATLAFFGAFSMAAFPLPIFGGFLSKEMFFTVSVHVGDQLTGINDIITTVIPIAALLGSVFTFVYSMILFFQTFVSKREKKLEKKPRDPKLGMLISPFLLMIMVVIIGLMPNLFNSTFLEQAAYAVSGEHYDTPIQFWHGWNIPILMSAAVVVLGGILYLTRTKWRSVYTYIPGKVTLSKGYNKLVKGIYSGSESITRRYMSGSLQNYLSFILVFIVIAAGGTLLLTSGFVFDMSDTAPITLPELLVAAAMAIAAVVTILMKSRVAAILSLGIVGYGISLLFIFFRAPDLALTQMVIETVSVVLFLLCFYHLPKLKPPKQSKSRKLLNAGISAAVGLILTLTAISAHGSKQFASIADYMIQHALDLGGGHNIVNVILVDIRGLDTMFEITVLGLAALGIYAMIKLRNEEGDQ